jgi:tetrahydromethanopterin S-methyltransferase subunit A
MIPTQQSKAIEEIQSGLDLAKCQQCGCMQETLDQINRALLHLSKDAGEVFRTRIPGWQAKMKPVRYRCLGCDHCFAGSAQNVFTSAFPQLAGAFGLSCEMQINVGAWPQVVGDYEVVDPVAAVAVVTLANLDLPKKLGDRHPTGLAITGKLETENIGIDKLIKNVISNPHLRYLIVTGVESAGHQSGQTLLALAKNGIDPTGQVIGSRGKRPVLRNVTNEEVEVFRHQLQVIDLIGCEDADRITRLIQELARPASEEAVEITPLVEISPCGCSGST